MELTAKQEVRLKVIGQIYERPQCMYENNIYSVPECNVSISQPYIRPIVRGKATAPVEFGAKLVEPERAFRLAKRCYGLGKIMTKLDTITRGSIALSILAMNIDRLASLSMLRFLISLFSKGRQHGFMLIYM